MLIAYIDCYAGLSGESLLDALVSAGLPRTQISGAFVDLSGAQNTLDNDASLLAEFEKALSASTLPALVKQVTQAVLARLQEAEAAVYTSAMQSVFHVTGLRNWDVEELGALVGVVYGLSLLGIDRVECSPLRVGCGSVEANGADRKLMPSLSPIAAELLRAGSIPVYGTEQKGELVTPIGAAFASTLVSQFGPLPAMKILSIGYGIEQEAGNGLHVSHLGDRPFTGSRQTRIFVGEALGIETAATPAHGVSASFHIETAHAIEAEAEAVPVETMPTQLQAIPEPARPYVESLGEWVAISIQGHQQSGRQRV